MKINNLLRTFSSSAAAAAAAVVVVMSLSSSAATPVPAGGIVVPIVQQKSAGDAGTPTEVITRGRPLGESPAVALARVLAEPQKYVEREVIIEGVIKRVCTRKGCWMELAPDAKAEESVRVTFKNYEFFVPLTSQGMKARAEGQFAVQVLSKDKADHYAEEGARLKRRPDGTAHEVTFVASGLELRK